MSGTDCTAAIIQEFPDASILVLSTHSGEEEIYRALHAGARGYIVKSIIREELLRAVREVHQGRQYVDPIVAAQLAERRSHCSLTGREVEVLRLVAKGLGNKQIANALDIAEVTVKLHVSHVLEKLRRCTQIGVSIPLTYVAKARALSLPLTCNIRSRRD